MSNCWDTAGPQGRAPVGAAGRDMTWTVRVMDPQSIEVSSEQFRHFEKRVTLLWNLQAGEHFICHFLSQAPSVSPNYPSWQPAADLVITSVLLINFHPGIWWRFGTAFRYSYWHAGALNKVKVRLRLHHTIKIKIVQFQFHHRYLMSFSNKTNPEISQRWTYPQPLSLPCRCESISVILHLWFWCLTVTVQLLKSTG